MFEPVHFTCELCPAVVDSLHDLAVHRMAAHPQFYDPPRPPPRKDRPRRSLWG